MVLSFVSQGVVLRKPSVHYIACGLQTLLIQPLYSEPSDGGTKEIKMSKKRAGWKAVDNLVALDDVGKWNQVENHWDETTRLVPRLREHQTALEEMGSVKEFFTKDELDKIVLWKHAVGKTRIFNVKYINANSDTTVRNNSKIAIALAMKIQLNECLNENGVLTAKGKKSIQDAIVALTKNISGVGPATASAMLTIVRPDIFCYMYDEAVDCFEAKRSYTISNYLGVNTRCLEKANDLGEGWTTNRVAKTIWTAARFLAINEKDLTEEDDIGAGEDGEEQEEKEDDGKQVNGGEGSGPSKPPRRR